MAAPVLTQAAVLACAHGARAIALPSSPRVSCSGAVMLCVGDAVVVQGCDAAPACGALRLAASTRVTASGRPLALQGTAIATGNGAPAVAVARAARVFAR